MFVTSLRSMAAATVVALTALAAPVFARAADLFMLVEEPPSVGPPDALTLRSRVVTMDLGQLDRAQAALADPPGQTTQIRDASPRTDKSSTTPAPGTTLTLNLFDDTVVTGLVEYTEPTFSGGYAVSGRLVEQPLGTMTLVVNGETVAGTVRLVGRPTVSAQSAPDWRPSARSRSRHSTVGWKSPISSPTTSTDTPDVGGLATPAPIPSAGSPGRAAARCGGPRPSPR